MSGIMKVRGKGKLEIIFIGSGAGGGTGMSFGDSNIIVRKDEILPGTGKTNILVNYNDNDMPFPINVGTANITANQISAILLTSSTANNFSDLANLVKSRTAGNIVDLIVPSVTFLNVLEQLIQTQLGNPGTYPFSNYFNVIIINKPYGMYEDIGIKIFGGDGDYSVYFDDKIYYAGNNMDDIQFLNA